MCEHSISNLWRAVEDLQIENQRLQARVTALEASQKQIIILLDSALDDIEWGNVHDIRRNHIHILEDLFNALRASGSDDARKNLARAAKDSEGSE